MTSPNQLFDSLKDVPDATQPPIEKWHPELSGDMDMVITADGRWMHEQEEITRHQLLKLFGSILRREDDGEYYLVTPVEKWRIQVDSHPLLIVESRTENREGSSLGSIVVRTNLDDVLTLGEEHPVRIEEDIPLVFVRHGLWAKVNRNVYYQWADLAQERDEPEPCMAIQSAGVWYPIGYM